MKNFENFYNKNYKRILILPLILLILSIVYLFFFYFDKGELFRKDVSLTGGTTITLFSNLNSKDIENHLSKSLVNFEIRTLSDATGKQSQIVIVVREEDTEKLKSSLESFLGYNLTSENSSIETTSSSLSANFYTQLLAAVFLAFFWMSAVVFFIFSDKLKIKILVIIINLIIGFILGSSIINSFSYFNFILVVFLSVFLVYIYIKNSIPAFAVIFAAFSDITLTLAVVNILGFELSSAGIVAFLMLIGYSVDTDILLTTRVLRRKDKTINQELFSAFKTGLTMSLTSIIALLVSLFFVFRFGSVLNQIFLILSIGLFFDIIFTWLGNASIIKWYLERKNEDNP